MDHSPFVDLAQDYDAWFDNYPFVYDAELRAVRSILPTTGRGLELGVGSGRFASALNITLGFDQALPMLVMAQERGVRVGCGLAEALPIITGAIDYVLMVTVLCFLKNPLVAFSEIKRVLKSGGRVVVAFIDRTSRLGITYQQHQSESDFYRQAKFYSVTEVLSLLRQAGFADFVIRQALGGSLNEIGPNEPVLTGWGQGGFVVVSAGCVD